MPSVLYRTHEKDVFKLIYSYGGAVASGQSSGFSTFRRIWKECYASYLIEGSRADLTEEQHVQNLFAAALDCINTSHGSDLPSPQAHHLPGGSRDQQFSEANVSDGKEDISLEIVGDDQNSVSWDIQLGALFALYCIYETQPGRPIVRIYMPLGILCQLLEIAEDAQRHGMLEPLKILNRMAATNAFLYSTENINLINIRENPNTVLSITQTQTCNDSEKERAVEREALYHITSTLGSITNFNSLQQLYNDYSSSRLRIWSTTSNVVNEDVPPPIADMHLVPRVRNYLASEAERMANTLEMPQPEKALNVPQPAETAESLSAMLGTDEDVLSSGSQSPVLSEHDDEEANVLSAALVEALESSGDEGIDLAVLPKGARRVLKKQAAERQSLKRIGRQWLLKQQRSCKKSRTSLSRSRSKHEDMPSLPGLPPAASETLGIEMSSAPLRKSASDADIQDVLNQVFGDGNSSDDGCGNEVSLSVSDQLVSGKPQTRSRVQKDSVAIMDTGVAMPRSKQARRSNVKLRRSQQLEQHQPRTTANEDHQSLPSNSGRQSEAGGEEQHDQHMTLDEITSSVAAVPTTAHAVAPTLPAATQPAQLLTDIDQSAAPLSLPASPNQAVQSVKETDTISALETIEHHDATKQGQWVHSPPLIDSDETRQQGQAAELQPMTHRSPVHASPTKSASIDFAALLADTDKLLRQAEEALEFDAEI